jgi:hypothetical protein
MLQLPRVRPLIFPCLPFFASITDYFPFGPYSLEAQPPLIIPIAIDRIYSLPSLSPLVHFSFSLGPLDP